MRAVLFVLTLTIALLCSKAYTQVDTTFGTNGVTVTNPGLSSGPIASFVLPDGKILVIVRAGCCGSTPGREVYFYRFNSNGTPDTTYSATGFKQITIPFTIQGLARAAARQA